MIKKTRLIFLILVALCPQFLKKSLYRVFFGYKIGRNVRIGLSLIDAGICEIADDVTIGHFNLILGVRKLSIGDNTRIGTLNIIRGGDEVSIGRYCEIIRLNEINSIPDPVVSNPVDQRFILGSGSVITASHKIDFTDRVQFGERVILGGRNSSLWTHSRQSTLPISVGRQTYVGSEVRFAPGSAIGRKCVVGIGAVITKPFSEEGGVIAGVPARWIKEISPEDKALIDFKTRPDLPDDI